MLHGAEAAYSMLISARAAIEVRHDPGPLLSDLRNGKPAPGTSVQWQLRQQRFTKIAGEAEFEADRTPVDCRCDQRKTPCRREAAK